MIASTYFKHEKTNFDPVHDPQIGIFEKMFRHAPYVLIEKIFTEKGNGSKMEAEVTWISKQDQKNNQTHMTTEPILAIPGKAKPVSKRYFLDRTNLEQ